MGNGAFVIPGNALGGLMPRLRVDRDTSDAEITDALRNLIDAGHVIDAKLADPRLFDRHTRRIHEDARDGIHVEINRLVTIMLARSRARQTTVA